MANTTHCPVCHSEDIIRVTHPPSFALPESSSWECLECEHTWGTE